MRARVLFGKARFAFDLHGGGATFTFLVSTRPFILIERSSPWRFDGDFNTTALHINFFGRRS